MTTTGTRQLVQQALPGAIECRFAPSSIDADARTAEVTWTTGARVLRQSWNGKYFEELDVSPSAVRLERLNSGSAPLLDTHDTWDLDSVIGVVESASIKAGEGRAVVKFSARNERAQAAFDGVREGVIRNVSVGYIVHRAEETEASEDSPPIRRAIDWEPVELSFVPVGADSGAGIRSAQQAKTNDCLVISAVAPADVYVQRRIASSPLLRAAEKSGQLNLKSLEREAEIDAARRSGDTWRAAYLKSGIRLKDGRQ